MAEDLINSIIDEAAIQKQISNTNRSLDELITKIKQFNVLPVGAGADNLKTLNEQTKNYVSSLDNIAASTKNVVASETQLVAIQNQSISAYKQQNSTLNENLQTRIRYQNTLKSLQVEQKEDLALLKEGVISQQEYRARLLENTAAQEKYRLQISGISREIKGQSSAVNGLLSPYQQLTAKYESAAKNAKDLAVQFGANSVQAKAAAKEALLLNTQLQGIDKTVGQSQKNVGNYGSAFSKAFGGIRTLANILPGIGLSGIFLLGFEAISKAADAIGLFNKKLSDSVRQRQLLSEVTAEQNKNAGSEIANLQVLYKVATNTNLSIGERKKAVDELQKQYPDYFKNIKDEIILQGGAKTAYDNTKLAILEVAKTRAIETRLTALATEELDLLDKKQDIIRKKQANDVAKRKADLKDSRDPEQRGLDQFAAISEGTSLAAAEGDANKKLADIAKDRDFLLNQIKTADKKIETTTTKSPVTLASTKATLDSDFEIYKIAQLRKIKLLEDGVSDESKTYDERIALLQDFSNASLELNDRQTANDKRALEQQLAAQQANLKKVKGTERNNLLTEIANTETKIRTLDAKNFDDRLKIFENNQKKFTEVEKSAADQEEKIRKEAYDKALKDAEANATDIKAALDRQLENRLQIVNSKEDKGIISAKEANVQREKLEFDYHTQSIRNELAYAKRILEIQRAAGIDTTDQLKAVLKLAAELEATIAKSGEDSNKKQLISDAELAKRKKDLYKQLYSEIQQTIFQFLDDGLKREEQDLDERKRLLDEDTAKRIANVNQLGLSEVERVKQTAIIEKAAAFQTEQIEARKRAIAVQQAKYQKAASIANIIASTAEAIVSALKIEPGGFVLSLLIGAIGAAQLARAISTPLPKYKMGRGFGKDEDAIVGDGGQHEFIKRASGLIERTPNVPTLTHLGPQDIVYKDQESLMRAMMNATMRGTNVRGGRQADNGFLDLINEQKRTTRAIQNMKQSILIKNSPAIESSAWYMKQFKN